MMFDDAWTWQHVVSLIGGSAFAIWWFVIREEVKR
jgi:hypothetical protein